MFRNIWVRSLLVVFGSAVIGLIPAIVADAANPESVTVDIVFLAPITISTTVNLQFGLLDVNMALNDTVTIAPDDGVSQSTPRVIGGTQAAARLTIGATASQAITITADSPTNGTYYTLGSFMCNYDGAASDSACGSGYSETSAGSAVLLVGATLTGAGGASAVTDDSTFDVTVTYQ